MNLELLKGQLTRTIEKEQDEERFERRKVGLDWPEYAETMIGLKRMDNIRECIEIILKDNIEGDLIECGVWRGGACIWMKSILNEYQSQKHVLVADSFCGFPVNLKYGLDQEESYIQEEVLKVTKDTVKKNFADYGVLDDSVEFIEGFFSETLSKLKRSISLLRIDCDLFESTTDVLENLYFQVVKGGFVIIDDYGKLPVCKLAVDMFRMKYKIVEQIELIDYSGIYWRKL